MIQNLRKKVSKNKAKKLRRYNLKSLKKPRMYGGSGVPAQIPSTKKWYQKGVTDDQSHEIATLIQTIHAKNLTGRVPFGTKTLDINQENWKDFVQKKNDGDVFIAAMKTIIALNDKQGQQGQQGQSGQQGQQGQSGQDQVALGQQDQQCSNQPKYVYMTVDKLKTLLIDKDKNTFLENLSDDNFVKKDIIEKINKRINK
jgi:hypothetical protein